MILTPEGIAAKQNSCSNCQHCRKPNFFGDSDEWMCRAPENLYGVIDVVTGEYKAGHKLCRDIRYYLSQEDIGEITRIQYVCQWHKPERIYNSDGTSKSARVEPLEISTPSLRKSLKLTTVEDI